MLKSIRIEMNALFYFRHIKGTEFQANGIQESN